MIERKARLHTDFHLVGLRAAAHLVSMLYRQAGDRAAAMQVQQRARELAAVVSLLVAKVVGAEQLAGGVVEAVGADARNQRVRPPGRGRTYWRHGLPGR